MKCGCGTPPHYAEVFFCFYSFQIILESFLFGVILPSKRLSPFISDQLEVKCLSDFCLHLDDLPLSLGSSRLRHNERTEEALALVPGTDVSSLVTSP